MIFQRASLKEAGRITIALFLVAQIVLGYVGQTIIVAQAAVTGGINTNTQPLSAGTRPTYSGVEGSIEKYLCTPTESTLGGSLFSCITKFYRFGVAFGAIALVFFVVLAGYLYISGGEGSKAKGKSIFTAALTGMIIILSSYVLLGFINPELTKIKPIQPPIFSASSLPKCSDVGYGQNCVLPSGGVYNPSGGGTPGSASEAQYKGLIARYAQTNGLEYCALSALIQKESTFKQYTVSNFGKPGGIGNVDVNSANKKFYNLTFTYAYPGSSQIGHGIGLTQVFIYGPPSRPIDPWQDSSTPSRKGAGFGVNGFLTVTDLINPEKSISAGAYFFGNLYKKSNSNLFEAYKRYTGGHENAALRKMVGYYDACKARS